MNRYINADILIADLVHRNCLPATVKRAIAEAPTADVSEECCNLLLKVKKLTEENERLHATCTELAQRLHEANEENISVCLKNFDLICENDRIKTDTVRKMRERIKEECLKGGLYPVFVHRTINRIAKEILEETQPIGGD